MFTHRKKALQYFTIFGDGLISLASFALAYRVRLGLEFLPDLYPLQYYSWLVPLVVGLWLSVGFSLRLYRDMDDNGLGYVVGAPVRVAAVATPALFALTFALKLHYVSRLLLGMFAVFDLLLTVGFRLLMRVLDERFPHWLAVPRNVLVVGGTREATEVGRILKSEERLGARLFGFAVMDSGDEVATDATDSSQPVYRLDEVGELLRHHVIDEVVFAVSNKDLERLEETFLLCEKEGVKVRVLLSIFPHAVSHVTLDRLQGIPLLTFSTTPQNESLLLLKRGVDVALAAGLLVMLSPFLVVFSLLIKITSEGSVLFRQTRCGLGGRKFTLHKFRSMRVGADQMREALQERNEQDGVAFKIRNDPRCTRVGRIMRKFSLDELPQLWNVLKGDMSLVGPRPPLPEEVDKYERWQRRRLRMKPGLTCLWALEGRNTLSFKRWMELDLQYIDTWSPALDWEILLKTIPVVLSGRGAS